MKVLEKADSFGLLLGCMLTPPYRERKGKEEVKSKKVKGKSKKAKRNEEQVRRAER